MFKYAYTVTKLNPILNSVHASKQIFKNVPQYNFHSNSGPLAGIRILDLSRILAGPYATMILGDLGAEIIKVERPGTGDDTRLWGPPFIGEESCYFLSVNRNKKSIVIDFKKPEGVSLMKALAKKSDVLVENFVPGTLDKLGLGYDSFESIAPQLIYCSLTGYGSSGPYMNKPGYDVIAASIGGLLSVTGPKNGDPCKVGVAMTDIATGLYLHGAIMAALMQRQSSNRGQKIDCDLLSTQISCLVNLASNYLNGGIVGQRWGTEHESIVPYQAFKTKDGFITIGAGNNKQFKSLCQVLNKTDLPESSNYKTNAQRVKNRDSLIQELKECFVNKITKEWVTILNDSSFPFGPINSLDETFSDPQVVHSNIVQDIQHSTEGNIKLVGPAVKYSQSSNSIRSPPPSLGQHTRQILSDLLQFTDTKINSLEKEGIIEC